MSCLLEEKSVLSRYQFKIRNYDLLSFAELIHRQAEKYGNRTALKHRDNATGKWLKISWREFSDKVMLTAKAMAEFGIKVQENIGVYSQNMPQCLYTDFGAYGNRVVSIPMYATNSPGQIEYIINDAKIHTLFVGEQLQYNNAFKVQKDSKYLERLVVFDPAVKMNPEDKTSIYLMISCAWGITRMRRAR